MRWQAGTVQSSHGILYNFMGHRGLMGLMGSLMANLDMTGVATLQCNLPVWAVLSPLLASASVYMQVWMPGVQWKGCHLCGNSFSAPSSVSVFTHERTPTCHLPSNLMLLKQMNRLIVMYNGIANLQSWHTTVKMNILWWSILRIYLPWICLSAWNCPSQNSTR